MTNASDQQSRIIEQVTVPLGNRSYDIVIGDKLLQDLGANIKDLLRNNRAIIITDDNVAAHHLSAAMDSLEAADIRCDFITLPAGESTKSFQNFEKLLDELMEMKAERKDCLVALGGGVIGDITGFAASVLLRGVDFIQVPTTLLSQVDSSVGGKTGINTSYGKNLVGAFYQPRKVIIDLALLDTLPHREMLAGYAEVVKYGVIDNPQFFDWLEEQGAKLISGDRNRQAHAVATSCRAKARIVATDEREGGIRALLNLGHTFGHALEAELGYDGRILHGEAIAIGMVHALKASALQLGTPVSDADRLAAHFRAVGLPASLTDVDVEWDIDKLLDHMALDKKVDQGKMVFILARGIGKSLICRDVALSVVREVLVEDVEH